MYFTGHIDSQTINDYLNKLSEDSSDFQVVYQLRQMGEKFNDGTLSLREVSESSRWFQNVSNSAEAFIHQMKCWTFYITLRAIASGNELTPFQQKVKDEIEHPSFVGPATTIPQKLQCIWKVRWKHPLVFNEPPLALVITCMWSVIRMQKIVRER